MTDILELLEMKDGIRDVDPATVRTGAMIALRPRQDHIDRLAVVDGEEPDELHTTILFLGKAADYSYDTRARIINAMREVAQRFRFVTANGFAINLFNPQGDEPCIVLGVGGTELVDIRNAIVQALQGFDLLMVPEQHEPWVPHITLNYTDDFSLVEEYASEDLTGDVVFDAIRVVFAGIVDDIPLQQALSTNDGYAGGNRYAMVPPTIAKTFRTERVVSAGSGRDLYSFLGRTVELEEKVVRHVRTAAGVRRFGQPIGSVIVGEGNTPLKNLKEAESEYDGYNKYKGRGKTYYTHKNGDRYEALDQNDNVIASNTSEENLLRDLDAGSFKHGSTGHVKAPGSKLLYDKFEKVESDYEGYDKYTAPDGTEVYRDLRTNHYYDADDNELSDVKLRSLNESGQGKTPGKQTEVPYGLKKAESEYDGYDKFTGKNGVAVYRDQADGKFYDENDKPIRDISKYADTGAGTTTGGVAKRTERVTPAPKPNASPVSNEVTEVRDALVDQPIADGLDAIIRDMGGKKPTDAAIEKIRELAKRAGDARDRRKLNLLAQQLSDTKTFAELVDSDFRLRMDVMEVKLITPGGRVGSDRKLGSRANGENWVERSKVSGGALPKYIRIVRNGLMKAGHSQARATALAVAAMKRWARGGDNVRPQVASAAAAALAQWEAMRAAA